MECVTVLLWLYDGVSVNDQNDEFEITVHIEVNGQINGNTVFESHN